MDGTGAKLLPALLALDLSPLDVVRGLEVGFTVRARKGNRHGNESRVRGVGGDCTRIRWFVSRVWPSPKREERRQGGGCRRRSCSSNAVRSLRDRTSRAPEEDVPAGHKSCPLTE